MRNSLLILICGLLLLSFPASAMSHKEAADGATTVAKWFINKQNDTLTGMSFVKYALSISTINALSTSPCQCAYPKHWLNVYVYYFEGATIVTES